MSQAAPGEAVLIGRDNVGDGATPTKLTGGDAELEVFQTYASGDLAVLVAIERQHGEVGGLPDQDWSLRVTLVYRRQGAEWWLVHRHADPLVRNVGLETAAALAVATISDRS